MKKVLVSFSLLSLLGLGLYYLTKQEGVTGQAYLSLGDKFRGQALVDFPVYCYEKDFDISLEALKGSLQAEYDRIETKNDEYVTQYESAFVKYIELVKGHVLSLIC